MKPATLAILFMSVLAVLNQALAGTMPLSTSFTYQGHLKLDGGLVTNTADFQFTLWDAASGPTQVAGPFAVNGASVTNGLFAVEIDFGANVFNGEARWLQIAVRSPAGSGSFTTIGPRQPLTALPYSLQTRGIFVDNSGKVGIGTTTPGSIITNSKLDVIGGHIVVANDFGFLSRNAAANGIGAGLDTTPADDLALFASGSERVRVTAGGAVGIGTATPGEKLTVAGSMEIGTGAGDYQHLRIGGGNSSGFVYGSYPGIGDGIHMGYNFYYNGAGSPVIPNPGGGTSRITTGYGHVDVAAETFLGAQPVLLLRVQPGSSFFTSTLLGINVSTPGFMLHVNGSAGKPGGGSWSNSSDRRLKKDIEPLVGALDQLLSLQGVTFEYIDPKAVNELEGRRVGMIAQDVEEVFPDWVEERTDGYKTVTYRGFEALAVEALRELRAERDAAIATLRAEKDAEIAALRDQLAALEQSVQVLLAREDGGAR